MAQAISFRRGTTEENDQFIGVEGEIVVDMGSATNPLSTMNNNTSVLKEDTHGAPSLRFHLGNSQVGGVILARADMANVDTKSLAIRDDEAPDIYHKGKNLAYADLENIYYNATNAPIVRDVLDEYGIAHKDTTNIDTTDLVDASKHSDTERQGDTGNKPLAYRDTTNINTADLADPNIHTGTDGNKPLAYRDASNIDTVGLAERDAATEQSFGKSLAYKDTTNINTTNLLNKTIHNGDNKNANIALLDYKMENINDDELKSRMDTMFGNNKFLEGYERVSYKAIDENTDNQLKSNILSKEKYPSSYALYNYMEDNVTNGGWAKSTLNNITGTGWQVATGNSQSKFVLSAAIEDGGSDYSVGDTITTDVKINPSDPSEQFVIVTVTQVENGVIKQITTNKNNIVFEDNYFKNKVSYIDPQKGAEFNFSRIPTNYSELYKLTTTKAESGSNYIIGEVITTNHKLITDDPNEPYLAITVLEVHNGAIVKYKTNRDDIVFKDQYLQNTLTYTDSKGASFNFSREPVNCGDLMKNDLSNSQYIENEDYRARIGYTTFQSTDPNAPNRIVPYFMNQYKVTGNIAVVNCTGTYHTRYDLNNVAHTGWSTVAQISTRTENEENKYGLLATEDGIYYLQDRNWNFNRKNLITTVGYCDEKQNTQNIEVITSGTETAKTVSLKSDIAIYSITTTDNMTITIDRSALTVANNTAKTFEIYVTVGATLNTVTWAGIDKWLADSEQTPLNADTTSIFTIRVQNIGGTIKVIANYGGEF